MRVTSHGRLKRAVLLCFGLLAAFASTASAGTVTLETDTVVFDPLCICNAPSVPGELRYEIWHAMPGDTIDIAPGVDPDLTQGQINIDKNLTIQGQGADETLIVVVTLNSRIFRIGSFAPASVVTIRNLTMGGGHPSSGAAGTGAAGADGGAIHTSADLTLDGVRFADNGAGDGGSGAVGASGNPGMPGGTGGPGGAGGAVFNTVGGDLTVTNSTFDNNSAGDGGAGGKGGNCAGCMIIGAAGAGGLGGPGRDGGAISNAGVMTVTNSTFFGNESGVGGAGGDVGDVGLGPGGDGGDGGDGGAIRQAGAGSVTISNSTIAGNVAGAGGAGGAATISPGAGDGDPGVGGAGGGTHFFTGPSAIVVANSLYSQNTAVSGSNCAGPGMITAQGANLSFPAGGCPGSFSNGDPLLGPLAANGGPTTTMALGPGSAAINQVPVGSANCPGADQRGVTRPQGPTCDIGAFELEMAPPPLGGDPAQTKPPAQTKKKCKKKKKKAKKRSAASAKKCKKKKKR